MAKVTSGAWVVAIRILAAVVGGYLSSWALSLWTPVVFQIEGDDARRLRTLVFFLYYATAILWIVAIQSQRQALLGVAIGNALAWSTWALYGGFIS